MIRLVREPDNSYDRNAIRVDNTIGRQVGHLKRELAKIISIIVDKNLARIEGYYYLVFRTL